MRLVGALLSPEIYAPIAGILGLGRLLALALETPVACPRFDQRTIDREMLIRQELALDLLSSRHSCALRPPFYTAPHSSEREFFNGLLTKRW
jgi:hypothetical protein